MGFRNYGTSVFWLFLVGLGDPSKYFTWDISFFVFVNTFFFCEVSWRKERGLGMTHTSLDKWLKKATPDYTGVTRVTRTPSGGYGLNWWREEVNRTWQWRTCNHCQGRPIVQRRYMLYRGIIQFFLGYIYILLIDKVRVKNKTYIWVSVRWKTKN